MALDDVIQIITPASDSQYVLLPCPVCNGDNVAYVLKVHEGNCFGKTVLWHGRCFDCDHTGEGAEVRHDAQLLWNKKSKEVHYGKNKVNAMR